MSQLEKPGAEPETGPSGAAVVAPIALPLAPLVVALLGATVSVVAGVLVLAWPEATLRFGAVVFGVQLVLLGATRVALGAFGRVEELWVRPVHVVGGLMVTIAGVVCLRHPVLSVAVIVLAIAVGWLVDGVALVVAGANASHGRVPMLAGGTSSIAAALVMLAFPVSTTAFLLSLGGWLLIAIGVVSMFGVPWLMRENRRTPGAA